MKAMQQVIRDYGLLGLARRAVQFAYRRAIRPLMPVTEPVRLAGLFGPYDLRAGDVALAGFFPLNSHRPRYEAALAEGLRQLVKAGDRVVVVGGGMGITAALAAQLAGNDGNVICFEGSTLQAALVRETARRNGVLVDVREAVVGAAIAVYGEASASVVPADQLPDCEVLQLDCEGAETLILSEMAIRPPVILVETHGLYGAPTMGVRGQLEGLGYAVDSLGVAEPDDAAFCESQDIMVLAATLRATR